MAGFGEPISPTRLPHSALIKGEGLSLPQLDMPCFIVQAERPGPFLTETEVEWIGRYKREAEGKKLEEGREEKLWSGCKIN